jgi:hypothetical protein
MVLLSIGLRGNPAHDMGAVFGLIPVWSFYSVDWQSVQASYHPHTVMGREAALGRNFQVESFIGKFHETFITTKGNLKNESYFP